MPIWPPSGQTLDNCCRWTRQMLRQGQREGERESDYSLYGLCSATQSHCTMQPLQSPHQSGPWQLMTFEIHIRYAIATTAIPPAVTAQPVPKPRPNSLRRRLREGCTAIQQSSNTQLRGAGNDLCAICQLSAPLPTTTSRRLPEDVTLLD
jgi:hypothetical protein